MLPHNAKGDPKTPWTSRYPAGITPRRLVGELYVFEFGTMLRGMQSGNTGMDRKTGEPVIYDPSSYYGHNEAE
jgi:hypothetical protein